MFIALVSVINVYASDDPLGHAPVLNNFINPYVQEPLPTLLSPSGRAFGYHYSNPSQGPAKFFLNTPGTVTYLSPQTDFFVGGSWVNGKWYAITSTALTLVTCDTVTGAKTVIGNLGISGSLGTLAWNPANSTMYLIAGVIPPRLYSVNITTGAASLVTSITGVPIIIDGAFSNGGILYGIEASGSGNFGRINITTGVWTTIGPTGIIPFFAQGCAFDRSDGILYWATLQQSMASDFRVIDTLTGASTVIATLPNGTEIDALVIPSVSTIGIEPVGNAVPEAYSLSQNYPNPFNPATNIKFQLPREEFVKLSIFDMLGREIEILVNKEMKPGTYRADWNASKFSSGVYFYRLEAGEFTETRKMILVK